MTDESKTPKVECATCKGSGIAETVNYRLRDGLLKITEETCWACKDTGKASPDDEVDK